MEKLVEVIAKAVVDEPVGDCCDVKTGSVL